MRDKPLDKPFLVAVFLLAAVGLLIFISASMGLLARTGASFSSTAFNQIVFGLVFGSIAAYLTSRLNYKFWRTYAFYIFLGSLLVSLLVYVPGLGFSHGGATRWIIVAGISFQPAELIKIGFIIYFAAWLSGVKEKIKLFRFGMLPFLIIVGLVGAILLAQPDTDTFMVIFAAGLAMFISEGGRFRDILILGILSLLAIGLLAMQRPYLMSRITVFLNPASDPLGAGYQIQQSLIAIGSGQITGRGFGQSIQKFNFLPEPIGDSIFAVAGEEFGFVGTVSLLLLFLYFTLRGLKIGTQAPDAFSRLVVVGIVILIIIQAYLNIGAMLGLLPLSGITLPFVSHGGTALFFVLAEIGIILNISRYSK
ncbi:MAG: putative peptidoglycan glycosyltransferase FtsW [Candidatus Paceibacterota bacterium]|jgi:cell division protein FtsW